MASDTEEPDQSFQDILLLWEGRHAREGDPSAGNEFDPTEMFHKLSEILEREYNVYIASDPDPFDERHPSRVDQTCKLGQHLKSFFKWDIFVKDLFQLYLRENHFVRMGLTKDSFDLNVAACRLLLNIMPGLEISTLKEEDNLTNQLYKWVESADEPLNSYATGILSVVMEQYDFAAEQEIREKNSKIVPLLLRKLKELQVLGEEERAMEREERFKRPFALFSKSSPTKRRMSSEVDEQGEKLPKNGNHDITSSRKGYMKVDSLLKKTRDILGSRIRPGWPEGLKSPPYSGGQSLENSNSSWAEMEVNIIGHFQIFPISIQTKQIYILRLLAPLAEYQDFVPMAQESQILSVVKKYINVKETRDARLGFEALRLLGALFCHKKYTLEWVYTGGLDILMEMPRPSVAATGSALCIYYLACDHDTMEKICGLPQLTLERLVKYCLWLLECSHPSGRHYAIMFFGLAFPFKVLLDIFDAHDGLRRLYNSISTLPVIEDNENNQDIDEDELISQRATIRSALTALKAYAETHLAVRCEVELEKAAEQDGFSPEPPRPTSIPYKLEQNQVTENIDTLLKVMNFRARWPPIDEFIKLGSVGLLLKIMVKSYNDWILIGKEDIVKNALDIIAVCSILPRVQLFLCENFEAPEDKHSGITIIIACSEGEVVNDPSVQKAALLCLCHLLCGPISRPGSVKHQGERSNGRKRTSDDVINAVWECFRSNNGIMALLQLIQTKSPVADADKIRALACQALVGLARSPTGTQIMSKLPIFNNGVLNMLVREPVLQDNISEHQKFQKHAQELLEKVSGPVSQKSYENTDITLDMLHRASVVANTKIRFNNKQLFQLIHEHLLLSGLKKTAEAMRKEVDFVPLVSDSTAAVFCPNGMVSSSTQVPNRRLLLSPPPRPPSQRQVITPASARGSIQSRVQSMAAATTPLRNITDTPSRSSHSSLPIRLNRTPRSSTTANPFTPRLLPKPLDHVPGGRSPAVEPIDQERKVSLTSLVSDYLSNKHALCRNPMTTCPEFDLFLPHKCPDKRSKLEAPINFTRRQLRKSIKRPFCGPGGAKLDRKFLYSRFRPTKVFRASADERDTNMFTCCAFSGDGSYLMAGTSMGEMRMYNIASGEESAYQIHESSVNHIQPSRDGRLVLTSSSWRAPYSKLWSSGEFFDERCEYKDEEYVEFSKLTQDKVIGTRGEGVASVYDINTGQQMRLLKPKYSNGYNLNRACFDPTDDLILCDGVLWDYRMKREIHKLDKLNQNLSGVFHPSGLEIISNTEVWDIRTFHLQRTVPQLDQCRIVFNTAGDVMFGLQLEQEFDDEPKFETSFRTFECSDYTSIATIELKKSVLGLCSSWNDLNIAVVEQGSLDLVESVVRLYDVGRCRDAEDETEDGVDEEEEDEQEDFSDDMQDDDDDIDFLNDSIFGSNSNSEEDGEDGDDVELLAEEEPADDDEEGGEDDEAADDDNDAGDESVVVQDDGSNDSWEDID